METRVKKILLPSTINTKQLNGFFLSEKIPARSNSSLPLEFYIQQRDIYIYIHLNFTNFILPCNWISFFFTSIFETPSPPILTSPFDISVFPQSWSLHSISFSFSFNLPSQAPVCGSLSLTNLHIAAQ